METFILSFFGYDIIFIGYFWAIYRDLYLIFLSKNLGSYDLVHYTLVFSTSKLICYILGCSW